MASSLWKPIATIRQPICPITNNDVICSSTTYITNNTQYIVISFRFAGIYRYDVKNAIWSLLFDWDTDLSLNDLEGHFSIIIDNNLHLLGGYDPMYAILDMTSNTMNIKYNSSGDNMQSYNYQFNIKEPKAVLIGSNIHIIGYTLSLCHLVLDTVENKIKKFGSITTDNLKNFQLIYAEKINKLMVIGGQKVNSDFTSQMPDTPSMMPNIPSMMHVTRKAWTDTQNIWYCNTTNFEWKMYSSKAPRLTCWFSAFLICDMIIVIIYPNEQEIWCLDLWDDKWYQSETLLILDNPIIALDGNTKCIKVDEGTLHFMKHDVEEDVFDNDTENENFSYHVSINMLDIIPGKLESIYKRRHGMLIHGFIQDRTIPSGVMLLITQFYALIA